MELELRNLPIGTRIALALALPIAGLLALSTWIIANYHQTARETGNLRRVAEMAPAVSALVHELQLERGTSAGHISSSTEGTFSRNLPERHARTDQRRLELFEVIDRYDDAQEYNNSDTGYSVYLRPRMDLAREKLEQIWARRREVLERKISTGDTTTFYSEVIADLIGIVEAMQLVDTHSGLTREISAYTRLLLLKEQVGLERAIGAAGFSAHYFSAEALKRFAEITHQQSLHLQELRFLATPEQLALYEQTLYGFDEAEVQRMRRIALKSRTLGSTTGVSPEDWFDTMTRKIDRLRQVEDRFSAYLFERAATIESAAKKTAWHVSMLAAVLLSATLALAAVLARGIVFPLQRMTSVMNRLARGDHNASTDLADETRNDEIGDLARAALVFRENQQRFAQAEQQINIAAALRVHHQALGSINQGVLIADTELRPIFANVALDVMFGLAASDIPEHAGIPIGRAEGGIDCLSGLLPAFGSKTEFNGVLELHRTDGTSFWCDVTITRVLDATDRATHLVAILRDITETRRVEQELRIAATAFESLHGMMVTDAQGTILRVNKAFVDMTGFSVEEAVGQSPGILKSGRHPPEFYADMWKQIAVTGAWSGEIWDRRKSGEVYPKWQTISAVRGADGNISHYVAAFSDISERKAAEQRIHDLAFYDPLTRLPNRRLLLDRLHRALAASARNESHGALLFIDLDNFKSLNDTRGHDMGDLLLIEVADRLKTCLRGCDTAARLGGDEFIVMLEDLSHNADEAAAGTETVGNKVLETLNRDYILAGKPHRSTPSIGVTLFQGQKTAIEDLLKQADLAMYQAKAAGRNAMRFFDPNMQAVVSARSALEVDLRMALHDNQFTLHYQPQVGRNGQIIGAEALLRWQHPQRGLVSPVEFIPVAEETGLILPIGLWVLRTACQRLAEWGRNETTASLTMAVNVSARQFRHIDFVDQVLAEIDDSGANPQCLKLELTESLLLDDVENTIEKMTQLKERGISFSLDDFGTGYSSLSYLKRLPLDQLKIDRSFVRDILTNPNDAIIAKAIVALGQSLGLAVIAEGVETEAQRQFLTEQNCQAFQGYLFGKPRPDPSPSTTGPADPI